jgi:hypothetical protein
MMRVGVIICVVLFAIGAAGPIEAAAPGIREAWVAPGNWSSIWLAKKDLARHFGQSYAYSIRSISSGRHR